MNSLFRSLSDLDSIDLGEFNDDFNQNNNTKSSNSTLNESFKPVRMVYTDFMSSNWIKNFEPQDKGDLTIHTKKLAELEEWFNAIKTKKLKSAPILLLIGPSGSGKTAAIQVLAKEYNYTISEWVTPVDIEYNRIDRNESENITYSESQNDKFSQFLFQSSRYRSVFDTQSKRLVLIEDFPNTFVKDPNSFEEVLE